MRVMPYGKSLSLEFDFWPSLQDKKNLADCFAYWTIHVVEFAFCPLFYQDLERSRFCPVLLNDHPTAAIFHQFFDGVRTLPSSLRHESAHKNEPSASLHISVHTRTPGRRHSKSVVSPIPFLIFSNMCDPSSNIISFLPF